MSKFMLSTIKLLSLVVFSAAFVCALYALPQHGWTPPYEEHKFWTDNRLVFSCVAIASLLVFIATIWVERRRNRKT